MLANKLNYGDTIGVVGVSNSLEINNHYECFNKAEKFLQDKGFKIKRGKYVLENYYGSAGTKEQMAEDILLEYTKQYDFPIVKCNDFGHEIVNSVIPIGVRCKIDSNNSKVEILDEFLN